MPPRLARLLAALAAIALVAGAFVVRGALAGDDGGDDRPGTDDGRDGDPPAGDGSVVRLVCDDDLGQDVCAAVAEAAGAEVEVLTAGRAIERAIADDADWDAWLTLDGVSGVLDVARQQEGLTPLVTTEGTELASSPLALLARAGPLDDCGEASPVEWTCVIDTPIRPPVAVPGPDTALGIVARAGAATALEGGTDYSRADFEGTENATRLRDLLRRSPAEAGPDTTRQTEAMVVRQGTAAAAITVDGLAAERAGTVRGQGAGLRVVTLDPEILVGVTFLALSPEGQRALDALEEDETYKTVRDALTAAGWPGEPESTTGLPESGVIYALREELGR